MITARQTFNVAFFTMLVHTHPAKLDESKKLNGSDNWASLLDSWGSVVGLAPETIADLKSEHYFMDPFSTFLDFKQQLETG